MSSHNGADPARPQQCNPRQADAFLPLAAALTQELRKFTEQLEWRLGTGQYEAARQTVQLVDSLLDSILACIDLAQDEHQ